MSRRPAIRSTRAQSVISGRHARGTAHSKAAVKKRLDVGWKEPGGQAFQVPSVSARNTNGSEPSFVQNCGTRFDLRYEASCSVSVNVDSSGRAGIKNKREEAKAAKEKKKTIKNPWKSFFEIAKPEYRHQVDLHVEAAEFDRS